LRLKAFGQAAFGKPLPNYNRTGPRGITQFGQIASFRARAFHLFGKIAMALSV
jgi:hypothetical protein